LLYCRNTVAILASFFQAGISKCGDTIEDLADQSEKMYNYATAYVAVPTNETRDKARMWFFIL